MHVSRKRKILALILLLLIVPIIYWMFSFRNGLFSGGQTKPGLSNTKETTDIVGRDKDAHDSFSLPELRTKLKVVRYPDEENFKQGLEIFQGKVEEITKDYVVLNGQRLPLLSNLKFYLVLGDSQTLSRAEIETLKTSIELDNMKKGDLARIVLKSISMNKLGISTSESGILTMYIIRPKK